MAEARKNKREARRVPSTGMYSNKWDMRCVNPCPRAYANPRPKRAS
jgi:hypothetical protein